MFFHQMSSECMTKAGGNTISTWEWLVKVDGKFGANFRRISSILLLFCCLGDRKHWKSFQLRIPPRHNAFVSIAPACLKERAVFPQRARHASSSLLQWAGIRKATTKGKGETVKHTFYMLNKIVQKFLFYFGSKISSVHMYISLSREK